MEDGKPVTVASFDIPDAAAKAATEAAATAKAEADGKVAARQCVPG